MPSTDLPTAGAMRAAKAILRSVDRALEKTIGHDPTDTGWDDETVADCARVIDRESGLKEAAEALNMAEDALAEIECEHKYGAWNATMTDDEINALSRCRSALARVEGGGESA